MNGLEETIGTNGFSMVFGLSTIGPDVFLVWQPLGSMVLRWFLVTGNHWTRWFFNGSQPLVKRWNGNDPSFRSIWFWTHMHKIWTWINYRSVEVRSEIFQTKPKAINNDKYIQRTPPKSDLRVLLYNPKDLRTLRHTLLYDIWEQQSQHSLSSFKKERNGTAFAVLAMFL